MQNYVITIARGFGSGGKQVGMELSSILGIPCYESQILNMASEYSNINKSLFYKNDEKLALGGRLLKLLKEAPNIDKEIHPSDKRFVSDDNLFNIQARVMLELAKTESCIIIGKCANHVLKDCDNVISVYIEAKREFCVARIMDRLGVDANEANKIIVKTDKYRADYYKYYSGGDYWTNPTSYDITLNSGRLGVHNCAKVISNYVEMKFADKKD